MMRRLLIGLAVAAVTAAGAAHAAPGPNRMPPLLRPHFSFQGVFGRYNKAALKRGFEVFQQACSSCHSLNRVAYHSLSAVGLTPAQIKALAAERRIQADPDGQGKPPDLSLLAVQKKGGADFIYSILMGYTPTPKGVTLPPNTFYNEYFPGHAIRMPPSLAPGAITYADGTKATVPQMAHDVTTFLNWAAEPHLDQRKALGVKVLGFVAFLTILLYALKRQIWKKVE